MNENLNLVEILKDCPKGTKLYSPVWGEVYLEKILVDPSYALSIIRLCDYNVILGEEALIEFYNKIN